MTAARTLVAVRPLAWPRDREMLERLDTSFVTDAIYRVIRESRGFSLVERSIDPPLRKSYSVSWHELEAASAAIVAVSGAAIVGVASLSYERWNRRAVATHLYVDAAARGQGVGSRLLHELQSRANALGARSLFVETQNVNLPAIRFYERRGFALVGLDTSLYDPMDTPDESALYLVLPLDVRPD